MNITTPILLSALVTATLPAQMSGSYLIDPATPTAFASFNDAIGALFTNGTSGPVEIMVAPGTYNESVLIPPIAGAAANAPITFRSRQGPGTVLLQGNGGDTIALLGISFARTRSIHFDGLDFTGAPGRAISATEYVEDIEIENCTFSGSFLTNRSGVYYQAIIESANIGNEIGWRIHHNRIRMTPFTTSTSHGIYISNGGGFEIHHNHFELNGANHAIYMQNNGSTVDRIYDNLFTGTMAMNASNTLSSVSALRLDSANYENYITHNTFALDIPGDGCCIVSGGYFSGGQPVQNHILGNIFHVEGNGVAIVLNVSGFGTNPLHADGNLYHVTSGVLFQVGSSIATGTPHPSLASWQTATGQDLGSIEADPLLQDPFGTPPDLRPTPPSPIIALAVATPNYVTDDYRGRLRDTRPDAGAYESTSFALYGAGCRGTGALAPLMGSTGIAGTNSFTFELSRARANAATVLYGGFSRTTSSAGPLPFDIGGGCAIQAAPDAVSSFVVSSTGQASAPYPIPSAAAFFGLDLYFQWAVLDPGSGSPYGIAVTGGGALQL
ncbi:MAG: hypothetical protein KDC98_01910 [Planctomycetes bacterium]|nr:hypothetical protein [Planctomycetota bacterium]